MSKFEEIKQKLACEYAGLEDETIEEQERVDKVILITRRCVPGWRFSSYPLRTLPY